MIHLGHSSEEVSIFGGYLHSLADDLAAQPVGTVSLIASDIIEHLPKAYKVLEN